MGMDNVPRCQHIKMNGTQCGSPALRSRRLCFFHDRIQRERTKIAKDMTAQHRFDLPLLEDANSVQVALMKVMQMLGSGRMDHRTAGLMLYAPQTASVNLHCAGSRWRSAAQQHIAGIHVAGAQHLHHFHERHLHRVGVFEQW